MSSTEEIRQVVRDNRSSESNFDLIVQQLDKSIALAQTENKSALAGELQEVKEKYAAEYEKVKETGSTAWPQFEKFVTHFERTLTQAAKDA
jgi:hypothetical protein